MKNLPTPDSKTKKIPKELQAALKLVAEPLAAVEERVRAQSRAFDPALEEYVAYACESNGKRLRPALALLAAGCTGPLEPHHTELALVIELIHAATLVHDDIIDGAKLRRSQPTANAKWGGAISVLLGDALFAHALGLSTAFDNREIGRRIARATADVCSGEIIQTQRRFDLDLTVADYFKIIEMKTATLFAAATELAAMNNDAPEASAAALRTFGLKLGSAYQIYDDCLDIAGEESKAGKTLGSDLRKGKLTLPALLLLEGASGPDRRRWKQLLRDAADTEEILDAIRVTGALERTIRTAITLICEGTEALAVLPETPYRAGLQNIGKSVDRLLKQFI